jgi:hypothetical protein
MVKKRKLSPQSVWDTEALQAAFLEHDIKYVHVVNLYKCGSGPSAHFTVPTVVLKVHAREQAAVLRRLTASDQS